MLNMTTIKGLLLAGLFGISGLLAGCGGGGAGGTGTDVGPGTGSGGTASPSLTLELRNGAGSTITNISSGQPGTATATVRDASGSVVVGALVTFSTDSQYGTIDPVSGTTLTNASGVAVVTLNPGTVAGASRLTATAIYQSAGTDVSVVNSLNYASSVVGVVSPAVTIAAPVFGITSPSLSAYGTTSVSATVSGSSSPLTVSFTSVCSVANRASITAQVLTIDGVATASYKDNGCASTDTITATVMSGVSSSASLVVQPPSIGSIQFLSASPNNIVLKGTGGAGRQETSSVKFKVLDQAGNPIARSVDFVLSTDVGGITLTGGNTPTTSFAQSDATTGEVETTVSAGTVPTPVRVQATVNGTNISTMSDLLTISSGYPDQAHFSVSATILNIEGWDYDGVTTTLTARLADHFSNPVPDGTSVSFIAEGGQVQGACNTINSACSVLFTSQALRPTDGRVTVLAYAVGNEAFTDVNGNGLVDSHAERVDANGSGTDLPEAWVDYNESGIRDSNEPFVDFNGDGTYNAADGLYTGVLCEGNATLCSKALATPKTTLHIFQNFVVVMSGSGAMIDFVDGLGNLIFSRDLQGCAAPQSEHVVYLRVRDARGNAMPAGTLITTTTNNGAISSGGSYVVPNSIDKYGDNPDSSAFEYPVYVRNDAPVTSCVDPTPAGSLRVVVRTPKLVESIAILPLIN